MAIFLRTQRQGEATLSNDLAHRERCKVILGPQPPEMLKAIQSFKTGRMSGGVESLAAAGKPTFLVHRGFFRSLFCPRFTRSDSESEAPVDGPSYLASRAKLHPNLAQLRPYTR